MAVRLTVPALIKSTRYESLDHWRGLACLAVLVTHSAWNRSGTSGELVLETIAARLWIGVPVFFVISGYCISAAVDAHRRHGRPLSQYFTRRLRRIFPPYWYVLLGTATLVGILDVVGVPMVESDAFLRPWWYDARQWLGNLTLTETWRYHVLPGQKALLLGHAWTLCFEEQFYIVCGLLIWLAGRRFFLAGVGVSFGVAVTVLGSRLSGVEIDGFFFDGSWYQFWFGMVLYHAVNYGDRTSRVIAAAVFLIAAVLAAWQPQLLLAREKNPEQAFLVASVFACTALVLHRFDREIASAPFLRFFQLCGTMCYSLYLVHLPVVSIIKAVCFWASFKPTPLASLALCIPPSLLVAWWFHVSVERKFLNRPLAAVRTPKGQVASAPAI